MKGNIALVGFMGSGKTVVAKALAKELGLQSVDLDDIIEQREGRKITDIFAQDGEPYFRKVEKEIVGDISKGSKLVIACGGGVVLDSENMANLKSSCTVVYLKTNADVILKRTKDEAHRPLLNVDNPKKKIEEFLDSRSEYYEQADFTVDVSDLSIEQVVDKIKEIASE